MKRSSEVGDFAERGGEITNLEKKNMLRIVSVLGFIGLVLPAMSQPGTDFPTSVPPGYNLIWEDHFNGNAIDTANWIVGTLRDPKTGDLVPGAAGAHLLNNAYAGYITPENSYVKDGCLYLLNRKEQVTGTDPAGTYAYTSSWVMSMQRVHLNKGFIEVRARFPVGDKVWPAIWLVAEDLVWGPEWDILEYFGYREEVGYDDMGMHLCTGTSPDIHWKSHWITPFTDTYGTDFHTYGFEWTDDCARWFIDGKLVYTLEARETTGWPNEEMYLIMNNGQKTDSPDNHTVWPNTLEVDYIRMYQR